MTHLFRVASGLDSLVMGEPQIFGQVKEAFSVASEMGCTGSMLNKLFHSAFAAGKRVRTETALSEGAVSVSYAAVELARKIFGDLKGQGRPRARRGRDGQAHGDSHAVAGHRPPHHHQPYRGARHRARGDRSEAPPSPWESLNTGLVEADILITATGASVPIISRALISQTMKARRQRPLFVIDIAVPRDVEASAGDLEQVFLYNIDDLQAVVQENISKRGTAASRRRESSRRKSASFSAGCNSRGCGADDRRAPAAVRGDPAIRTATARAEAGVAAAGGARARRRNHPTDLEKLLISPTEQLKAASDADTVAAYSDALNRLFGLTSDDAADDGTLTTAGSGRSSKKPAQ